MLRNEIIEEHIHFPSSDSVLEGVLSYPETTAGPDFSVLLLSPHPHMGGNMDNNVIRHLSRRFAQDGCTSLRFNYRGVGESSIALPEKTSLYDYWAGIEQEQRYEELLPDIIDAYAYLQSAVEHPPNRIVIGYSLGAILAGMLAKEREPTHLVVIGPPVKKVSLDVYGHCALPKIFIAGDNDFTFAFQKFHGMFSALPTPKVFQQFKECDHFFRGREEDLYQTVRAFVTEKQS